MTATPTNGGLVREFCAENLTNIPAALAAGAQRIELCDNLAVGGTTPSIGVIRAAVDLCHNAGARVMCMIRPRGGNFCHSPIEARAMGADLLAALESNVDGVVFGCTRMDACGRMALDLGLTRQLCQLAEGRDVTFHMAFDEIAPELQLATIDTLSELGVSRVLTHGGAAGTPIGDNLSRLRAYVERAGGRMRILPGGGITWENAESVAASLGVREVHGTRIVRLDGMIG